MNGRKLIVIASALVALFAGACEDVPGPTFGALRVSVTTTGSDHDADGYEIAVDGAYRKTVGSQIVVIPGLSAGSHSVELGGVAFNCAVSGANPRSVTVRDGDTTGVVFAAHCLALAGSVQVTVATAGADLDPDGYTVRVDSGSGSPLPVNGATTIEGLHTGIHAVRLDEVAANCTVDGNNPQTVDVRFADTTEVTFQVACAAFGTIRVTTTTTGRDPDPNGYSVTVQGRTSNAPTNGTVTISQLLPGDYEVGVSDVAANCAVQGGNPATVHVASGATADVAFAVTCFAFGSIEVTTTTTGVDLDANGYDVTVQGRTSHVAANETVTIAALLPGEYVVTLDGVAVNCDLTSPNPATVTVPEGGTGVVAFVVTCAQARELAAAITGSDGNTDVYVVKTNGAGLTRLTTHASDDQGPAWSPDGGRIAFVSTRDGNSDIYVMNADGSGITRLTNDLAYDAQPAWSPDGSKIAFLSARGANDDIYVMNADGTSPVRLTSHPAEDGDPAWSPDGSRIAFVSTRDGNREIYVMSADGSGTTRLTNNSVDDVQPAWSPDGARLVFSRFTACDYYEYFCDYDLFVMNSDGSGATQLTSRSSDLGADWSADGLWIAFGATYCTYYYYGTCYETYRAVEVVRVDGSRLTDVVGNAFHPAWRP